MKKRLKGLLALWMALLIAVSMPVTTFAATINDVYFYFGSEILDEWKKVSSTDIEQLTGDEAFQLDTSFSGQFSSKIPNVYNVTGWKLWKVDSGLYVYSPTEFEKEASISQEVFDSNFQSTDSDDIRSVVVEPLLELNDKFHQPTNAEPYVSVGEEGIVDAYEWYSVKTYSVVKPSGSDEQLPADSIDCGKYDDANDYGKYETTLDTWSSDEKENSIFLNLYNLKEGDILRVIPVSGTTSTLEVSSSLESYMLDENGIYSWIVSDIESDMESSENTVSLGIFGKDTFSVQIKVIRDALEIKDVSRQDRSVFSGPNGTYFCKVTFTAGFTLKSDAFTYTRYDITSTQSADGSYKLQVGGADVEKAAPGDTVTIAPTPDIGYELDTVTVTNADGSNELVTENSFIMPDYPVTVNVTFKKLTYVVTLPSETVGYTVESTQTLPVNYGADYTFTVTLKDGYAPSVNFEVRTNNALLTATSVDGNVYTYTIQDITEAQEITVTGVVEKRDITKSEATGGSYTVKAGDTEVTAAAKDTVVIINPTPAEGYELDKVTVTKTGDSNAVVTVTNNSFTMPDYPITVSVTFKKLTYVVTLPQGQKAYTVTSEQTSPVGHRSNYTFMVTIEEGYATSDEFTVKTNNNPLTATSVNGNVYTYTIEDITETQEITVVGVKDGTAPVVKIIMDESNRWQSFLNKISFGLFFQEEKSLTIDATDAESGIQSVCYYLADADLFPEDKTYTAKDIESTITEWKAYAEKISLLENDTYVLYARAEDQAGNVSYASTTGIVVDTVLPVISGIKDGETYYGDTYFTISDDNLDNVTLDGITLELTDTTNTIIITADGNTHTIQATDKAGNQISYQVSVYETWTKDGISSAGTYHMKPGMPYKLGDGKWKVSGDDTIYESGNTFYVQESGTFEFQKQ